jgi:hypothetical protein
MEVEPSDEDFFRVLVLESLEIFTIIDESGEVGVISKTDLRESENLFCQNFFEKIL